MKDFDNRSIFSNVMGKSSVLLFWLTGIPNSSKQFLQVSEDNEVRQITLWRHLSLGRKCHRINFGLFYLLLSILLTSPAPCHFFAMSTCASHMDDAGVLRCTNTIIHRRRSRGQRGQLPPHLQTRGQTVSNAPISQTSWNNACKHRKKYRHM